MNLNDFELNTYLSGDSFSFFKRTSCQEYFFLKTREKKIPGEFLYILEEISFKKVFSDKISGEIIFQEKFLSWDFKQNKNNLKRKKKRKFDINFFSCVFTDLYLLSETLKDYSGKLLCLSYKQNRSEHNTVSSDAVYLWSLSLKLLVNPLRRSRKLSCSPQVSKCPSGCRLQGLISQVESDVERKLRTVCETGKTYEDMAEKSMKAMTHIYNYNRRVIVNIYSKTDCDWLTVWFDTLKTMWNNLILVCSFRAEVRGTSGEIGRESHITTEAVVQAVAGTRRAAPQRPETIGGLISNWGEAARGSFQSHFHRFHMPFFSFSSWFCLTLCHTGEN